MDNSTAAAPKSFADLPPLVLDSIFKGLEPEDKKSCRAVCKKWRFAVDDYSAFFNYNVLLNDENMAGVFQSECKITKLTVHPFMLPPALQATTVFNSAANVKELALRPKIIYCRGDDWLLRVPQMASLKFVLKQCSKIENLLLEEFALHAIVDPCFFTNIRLDCLTLMEVHIDGQFQANQHKALLSLAECHFPALSTLNLNFCRLEGYSSLRYYDLFLSFYKMIARHRASLRHLILLHTQAFMEDDNVVAEVKLIPAKQRKTLCRKLKDVKLRTFTMGTMMANKAQMCSYDGSYDKYLVMDQPNLTSLRVVGPEGHCADCPGILQMEFLVQTFGLENILGFSDGSSDLLNMASFFDCSWLKTTPALKSFLVEGSVRLLNIEALPTTLIKLQTTELLIAEQFDWIKTNLRNLATLELFSIGVDRLVTGTEFGEILDAFPELLQLELNCEHDMESINRYITMEVIEPHPENDKYKSIISIMVRTLCSHTAIFKFGRRPSV